MLKQLERLYEKNTANNTQLAEIRKEIADTKQQIHFLTMLNLQGTLDSVYFTKSSQELDQKLSIAQRKLHAQLDDISSERLDKLKSLIRILEQAEPMTDFDEITFKQTVKQITVLSENEIRFDLIGEVSFTEQITR